MSIEVGRFPEFAGQVAVVTGAASGIGAAIAMEFAVEGARLALVDINADEVQHRAVEIYDKTGTVALPVVADVANEHSVQAAVERILVDLGGLRYLVNSAVSFTAAGMNATTDQWNQSLGVNVRGAAQFTAACAAHMPRGSAIVNISSVSAHVAQPDRWTYNASKGAIVSLTRCQAVDLVRRGIRVNTVSPGWIWTPEVSRAADGDRDRWEPVWGRFHMMRRLGEAREVARAVLFLCSDDASFVTGTELMVDGGYSALGSEGLGDDSVFAGTS